MAGKHFYYVFQFNQDDISKSGIVKTKHRDIAERIAREQPIYIEPSHNITDVREPAMEWLGNWRDHYGEAVNRVRFIRTSFIKEVN